MNPLKEYYEYVVGQVWQPTNKDGRIVSRKINAFVTDRHTARILIRFASPKGTVSRCTLEQMREWVNNNNAITKGIPSMPDRVESGDNLPNIQQIIQQYNMDFPKGDISKYFNPYDRCVLFIDGPHLYHLTRKLATDIDFRQMLKYFQKQTNLIHAQYYSALVDSPEYSQLKKLIDWLSYNGYLVKLDKAYENVNHNNQFRVFGNQLINIAVDMLMMEDRVNHVIFIGCEENYIPLIKAVKTKGIVVTLISQRDIVADGLRREVDNFIQLEDILGNFVRKRKEIA